MCDKNQCNKPMSFNLLYRLRPHLNSNSAMCGTNGANEDYDDFNLSENIGSLNKSRQFQSAWELCRQKPRTPLLRRLASFRDGSKGILKRSISFTGLRSKRETSNMKWTSEVKAQEWRKSLRSLVENDTSISYNDLSFIDYDVLNDIDYANNNNNDASRMHQKKSMKVRSTQQDSGYDTFEETLSRSNDLQCLDVTSRLETLCFDHNTDNGVENNSTLNDCNDRCISDISKECVTSSKLDEFVLTVRKPILKRVRSQTYSQENEHSFDISDSDWLKSNTSKNNRGFERPYSLGRSRSLNQLDTLDLRQGITTSIDQSLQDSCSEPDCAKPLSSPNESVDAAVPPNLRKQVKTSNEYFTVKFASIGDEVYNEELLFPAKRGVTLQDCLRKICELRSINLRNCEIYIKRKRDEIRLIIPITQDTYSLVGKQVYITGKENSKKPTLEYSYSNQSQNFSSRSKYAHRSRTSSFFNSSTDDNNLISCATPSSHDADQSRKQIRQRLTAFFGTSKDSRYENLIDQLDIYSRQGIPSNINYPKGQCESIDALYKLDDDWRDIIEQFELNEKQQQQQTALWELMTSEISYIKMLKVVTDLFLACLKDLQGKNLLKDIDTDKLFSNITEILDANIVFWRNTLFPLVRDMRKIRQPVPIRSILDGFCNLRDTFHPYYKYCAEQSRCQYYCRECMESELFAAYLTWCESQKECNRLRLMDILVQPMQRLTKYSLLLKAILKHTENDDDRKCLQLMIETVDDFVIAVNLSLKNRQDKERLKGIIARIESYDIVEVKDDDIERLLKRDASLTQLDLTLPMIGCPVERKRHLLLEGDLKLKDSSVSKSEVHCFLLTDMLLICKPSTRKGNATMRVIRQPYLVDRLTVSELHKETPSLALIYKNEFGMAISAFILQSSDHKKLKGWKDGITKAQSLYNQAKRMTSLSGESFDTDYFTESNFEFDYQNLQLTTKGPVITSSCGSRVSSLAHSHSGSVEMNEPSLVSTKETARSLEGDTRTASASSDEGAQPLYHDKMNLSRAVYRQRSILPRSSNTLTVQQYNTLGQSMPNLALVSPTISTPPNTLLVPIGNMASSTHLLSPTHRGTSYPPSSPTRGNLQRSVAITQGKNPPLIKTRHIVSATSSTVSQDRSISMDTDNVSPDDPSIALTQGYSRQGMKRMYRMDKRYHTEGIVDDIKRNENKSKILKRLSWSCTVDKKDI